MAIFLWSGDRGALRSSVCAFQTRKMALKSEVCAHAQIKGSL
jgi:hypothetical protein